MPKLSELSARDRGAVIHAYQSNIATAVAILGRDSDLATRTRAEFGLSNSVSNTQVAVEVLNHVIKNGWVHELAAANAAKPKAVATAAKPALSPMPRAIAPKAAPSPVDYFNAYQHKIATNPAAARKFLAEYAPQIRAGAKIASKNQTK